MSQIRGMIRCSTWCRLTAIRAQQSLRNSSTCRQKWTVAGSYETPGLSVCKLPGITLTTYRNYSTEDREDGRLEREFDKAVDETLISLTDKFEDIAESLEVDEDYDISYENGVLTVVIDKSWGTYVINKQTPNRQIWLSSPLSGPKRYDLVDNKWVYSHDSVTLHELLTKEISEAFQQELNFTECAFGS